MLMLVLKIAFNVSSAIIVLITQIRTKDKFRNTSLSIAFGLIIISATLTAVDYSAGQRVNRERTADLKLIQTMSSSIQDLAFELQLRDIDASHEIGVALQIATEVHTRYSTTGSFSDYFQVVHNKDSIWHGTSSFQRFNNIECNYDTVKNIVRFVLNSFGISCDRGTRTGWEPQNIADLGKVSFSLFVYLLDVKDEKKFRPYEWCPIARIAIYANTFTPENLLLIADRALETRRGFDTFSFYFKPKSDRFFNDIDSTNFRIDPMNLRSTILECLD